MKETVYQAAICEYLQATKVFFFRVNNIPVFANGQFRRMGKFTIAGVSDIIALKRNVAFFIEVKAPKGKQSAAQKHFQNMVEVNGGVYILASTIEDLSPHF